MVTTAPIKVSPSTDQLVSHASHFLSMSKKDVVEVAVREYIDTHRDEINEGIRDALTQLDGSAGAAVRLLTGMSSEELDELGGLPE